MGYLGGVIMTIKDLDTETLTLLNKQSDNWYIKACPLWSSHLMDKDCRDCRLRKLCYLLNYYDNAIKEELALRKQGEHYDN
jgi:hypothetical protein